MNTMPEAAGYNEGAINVPSPITLADPHRDDMASYLLSGTDVSYTEIVRSTEQVAARLPSRRSTKPSRPSP